LKILSFNWHEPYIEIFARTNNEFLVVPPIADQKKQWHRNFRPVPDNVTLVDFNQALHCALFEVSLIICMTMEDILFLKRNYVSTPKLFVELNMLCEDCHTVDNKYEHEALLARIKSSGFLNGVHLSFISEKKRSDWDYLGENAPVVVSGVDTDYFYGYTGVEDRVLRVGNGMRQRDAMQGFSLGNTILEEVDSFIIGENNKDAHPSAIGPAYSLSDLRDKYRHNRVFLSCLDDKREDGYNLAMLEAMSTGMPVIAMHNSSLPKCDGIIEIQNIEEGKHEVKRLLHDLDLSRKLGTANRAYVIEHFNINRCAREWEAVFANLDCLESIVERAL